MERALLLNTKEEAELAFFEAKMTNQIDKMRVSAIDMSIKDANEALEKTKKDIGQLIEDKKAQILTIVRKEVAN